MYRFMVTIMFKLYDFYKIAVAVALYDHHSFKGFSNYLEMGYNIVSDFQASRDHGWTVHSFLLLKTVLYSVAAQQREGYFGFSTSLNNS